MLRLSGPKHNNNCGLRQPLAQVTSKSRLGLEQHREQNPAKGLRRNTALQSRGNVKDAENWDENSLQCGRNHWTKQVHLMYIYTARLLYSLRQTADINHRIDYIIETFI